MEKDGRYKEVKLLFKRGQIHGFSEIFSRELIPKTVLARDLKKNNDTITKLIQSPDGFKIKDVIEIAGLFELSLVDLAKLFEPDLKDNFKADHSYDRVKDFFNIGKIKQFKDIFKYVPIATVARDIGKSRGRFEPLERFTVRHISRIGKLSSIPFEKMFKIIDNQIKQKNYK